MISALGWHWAWLVYTLVCSDSLNNGVLVRKEKGWRMPAYCHQAPPLKVSLQDYLYHLTYLFGSLGPVWQ